MVKKDESKIIPFIYLFITICYIVSTIVFIMKIPGAADFVPIIRGRTETDLLITFVGIPILLCILTFFTKLITLINYKFTRMFQRNYDYYIVDLRNRIFPPRKLIPRALTPVLVAIALSLLVHSIPNIVGRITIEPLSSVIFLAIFLSPLVTVLFIPLWVYKDSGIVKVRKKSENRIPPDIHFYGKAQYQSWRGFAGISTPITYIIVIFPLVILGPHVALIVLLFPLFLIGFYLPMLLLYEKKINKISEKIIQKLNLPLLNIEDVERSLF